MECIVRVFHHLGDPDRCANPWSFDVFEELLEWIAGTSIQLTNDALGRIKKIVKGAALAKEFRHHADAKVATSDLAGVFLENGNEFVLYRAGQHGAADGDHG